MWYISISRWMWITIVLIGRFCVERHRCLHIMSTQMFIYGNIKSTSSHVHTIFNYNLIHCKYFSHNKPIKKFLKCKVDLSFTYNVMGQHKNDYILYI